MTAPELKPCPFCGKMASMSKDSDTDGYGAFYLIRCNSCRAKSPEFYAIEACPIFFTQVRDAWNTRIDLHDATKAQLEECEARLRKVVAALRFYADKEAYETQYERLPCDCCTDIFEPINDDKGEKARAVLAEIEKGGV